MGCPACRPLWCRFLGSVCQYLPEEEADVYHPESKQAPAPTGMDGSRVPVASRRTRAACLTPGSPTGLTQETPEPPEETQTREQQGQSRAEPGRGWCRRVLVEKFRIPVAGQTGSSRSKPAFEPVFHVGKEGGEPGIPHRPFGLEIGARGRVNPVGQRFRDTQGKVPAGRQPDGFTAQDRSIKRIVSDPVRGLLVTDIRIIV